MTLYGALFEDTKSNGIPQGRKFAKKGPQGAWKRLPQEMRDAYVKDLEGYFPEWLDPASEVEKNSIVWDDHGEIHLILVEDEGQELESVWNDSDDKWDHIEAEPVPGREPVKPSKPKGHEEPKGHDPEKMTGAAAPGISLKRKDRASRPPF